MSVSLVYFSKPAAGLMLETEGLVFCSYSGNGLHDHYAFPTLVGFFCSDAEERERRARPIPAIAWLLDAQLSFHHARSDD